MTSLNTNTSSNASPKVWLITGCSSGIGRELALAALARGDHVIATARNVNKLEDLKARGAAAVALDVTAEDDVVQQTVADAAQLYGGRIDILVNNAGYSLEGAVEECSDKEVYDQFNTNVFGIGRMQRAVLPFMRAQRSGVIANLGSIGGWRGAPACGWYCATKFAIAGLTESLRAEVAHLGIEATCIDLGSFRTQFGSNAISVENPLSDAGPVVDQVKKYLAARNGKQPGDPTKAAKVIVDALTKSGRCEGQALPLRLAIGNDTVPFITAVLERGQNELKEWADRVSGTDFDDISGSMTFKE